jgi:hypothetical protein
MPLPERRIVLESSGTKSLNGCYPTNASLHQIPPQRMMTAIRRGEQRPTGSQKQRLTGSGRNTITLYSNHSTGSGGDRLRGTPRHRTTGSVNQ